MRTIKPVFLNSCLTVLGLTTSAVKVRVMKTNNASITDHKPGDIVSPVWGQDTVALWGVIKRDRQKELEPETDLFSKLSAEGLVMEAGWIAQVVTVHLTHSPSCCATDGPTNQLKLAAFTTFTTLNCKEEEEGVGTERRRSKGFDVRTAEPPHYCSRFISTR